MDCLEEFEQKINEHIGHLERLNVLVGKKMEVLAKVIKGLRSLEKERMDACREYAAIDGAIEAYRFMVEEINSLSKIAEEVED